MRIIAGNYRGKKLFSPESDKVRPTADRAREALFNILHSSLEKDWSAYKLLDVFAGTGAFALEALSRGAAAVALIDKDTRSLEKCCLVSQRKRADQRFPAECPVFAAVRRQI